jgi:ketosteroid isomerase-like protein
MANRRFIAYAVLFVWVSATLSVAQQQSIASTSKPEDQVTQLERDWLTADGKGDVAFLQQMIADDFIGSSFDGGLLNKEDIIPQGGKPGGFAGATPGETNVRIFGDTAVLMGVITTADPQPNEIRVTLVCQKRPQGWKMIAARLTR